MSPTGEKLVNELLQSVREKITDGSKVNNNAADLKEKEGELPVSYRLKGIRSLVTPDLLYALARAGDGDTVVLAANGFPADRLAAAPDRVVHLDALCIPSVLKEIMKLISVTLNMLTISLTML